MNPLKADEYIENLLKIRTKSGDVKPFRMNPAQKKLYAVAKRQQEEGKPVRIIILKARQLGFSTLTEGLIFHGCCTHRNVQAMIVAHTEEATANLFRMSKLFLDELPPSARPMVKGSNAQEILLENPSKREKDREERPGLRSRIRCATAGGKGIGRSYTLQYVHASEYAFWPEGADGKAMTLAGILQAVPANPGTMVIIESTARGFDDFKERWDAAVAGENDFEAVFFAWFENPEYAMPVPPGTEWTPDEHELAARYGLSEEQLQWRRWCIANNCGGDLNTFHQEYPANPEEAFLHSGTGVFDNELISRRLEFAPEPVKVGSFEDDEWREDVHGAVTIYEEPRQGTPYVIGGDTAGEGSDYFTAIVLDNSTGKQVATLRHQFSEPEYVRQIYQLGRLYNWALLGIETNYSTYPVAKLQELDYPNQYNREREDSYTKQLKKSYGFRTDRQTRPRAIANMVDIFSSHPTWFVDRELLGEMLTFCYNEDHRPEALAGKHDDLVMACAIAYSVRHQQSTAVPERVEPQREKLITQIQRRTGHRRR